MESESCDEIHSPETETCRMQVKNSIEDIYDIDDEYLNSVFEATGNVKIKQPICVYSLKLDNLGLAAVDIKELSDIVYANSFSSEVHVLSHNFDNSYKENSQKKGFVQRENNEVDTKKFTEINILQHSSDVTALSYTNGHLLLSGCLDGTVKAWSRNYQFVQSFSVIRKCLSDIHSSPRMDYFVTSSLTALQSVKGHETYGAFMFAFSHKNPIMTFLGHTAAAQCVRIHSNGKYIATASEDNTIKMWDTQTSKCVRTFQSENKEAPHLRKIAFSPDGYYLASTYYGSVKIWDLASGRLLKTLGDSYSMLPIYNICYCKFGHRLAVGGSDGVLKIFNMKDFSLESSDTNAGVGLLECHEINKPIFNINCTNNIFSCISAEL